MSKFFYSSIGKKILMSLAGLFLCAFLVVHLGINLLLLRQDQGTAFKAGVEFMTTNPVIRIMEILLFGGFLIHIIWGVIVQIQNWLARPSRYAVTNNSQTSFFSKYMIHTGAIIFIFLAIHLMNFYFVKMGLSSAPQGTVAVQDQHDFYDMAINLFNQPAYSVLYIVFMAFLCFHLLHAFQSAFQTLGINHKKYSPFIKYFGIVYSIVISAGFAFIPVYFLFFWK